MYVYNLGRFSLCMYGFRTNSSIFGINKYINNMRLYEVRLKNGAVNKGEGVFVWAVDSTMAMATALDHCMRKGDAKLNNFDNIGVYVVVAEANIIRSKDFNKLEDKTVCSDQSHRSMIASGKHLNKYCSLCGTNLKRFL